MVAFTHGPVEVADGVLAYLQPDGSWGWSNAGLVSAGGRSLLVDTLFDVPLTVRMLDELRAVERAAASIDVVVNTHANGDHCWGNSAVAGAEIVASSACAAELGELAPETLATLVESGAALGPGAAWLAEVFAPFDFRSVVLVPPTRTFDGELELDVGGRRVRLLEVGPAHTRGDVVVEVPDARVVFTGDILFHGGHPIVWAGPVSNWVAACERIEAMDVDVVVPGHGPLADRRAVADLRGYLEWVLAEARPRFEAGMAPLDAARDIDASRYDGWGEGERLVVNVATAYRDLGWTDPPGSRVDLFGAMADYARGR